MNETTSKDQETVKIYPDTTHQTRLSLEAQAFRAAYKIMNTNSLATRTRQRNLITEEFKEFLEADGMLFRNSPEFPQNCLKELSDLVYVCYQYAANMGWDLDEAMFRVHQSNMSKLDDEGKPIYREDGKVLKGPNYKPPNLEDLV
jgi:predicted HAD superfamily Cof-like phosphohydrolase